MEIPASIAMNREPEALQDMPVRSPGTGFRDNHLGSRDPGHGFRIRDSEIWTDLRQIWTDFWAIWTDFWEMRTSFWEIRMDFSEIQTDF
jgi:hypothetical protein